jgi:IS5 family transposase
MAICDANGLLIALAPGSASLHESSWVDTTIAACPLKEFSAILVGDKAYDADKLASKLLARGIRLIAPKRINRKGSHKDGISHRRFRRRWKIERYFAWRQNHRKVAIRYEIKIYYWVGYILLAASNVTKIWIMG